MVPGGLRRRSTRRVCHAGLECRASAGIIGSWFLWKLLIDHHHQRLGYGREVMRQVVELVQGQGATELLNSFTSGDGSPARFYELLGFVPTGDVDDEGEMLASLPLGGVQDRRVP